MSSKFARSVAEARISRGYHSSGVTILRPSTRVTASSLGVNSTARGRRSPTSISKVLMPGSQQLIPMELEVTNNISKYVGRKAGIDGDPQIVKPDFHFPIASTNVDMSGLSAFVGIEIGSVGTPP